MQTIAEFGGGKITLLEFWLSTAPPVVVILLLGVVIIMWKPPLTVELRTLLEIGLSRSPKKRIRDPEDANPPRTCPNSFSVARAAPDWPNLQDQAPTDLPLPRPAGGSRG